MDPALSGNGRAGTHLMPAYEPLVRLVIDMVNVVPAKWWLAFYSLTRFNR